MQTTSLVLTKKTLFDNPTAIGRALADLANAIQRNNGKISEIKDRNFFDRLFTNNTKDLAEAMIAQNDSTSALLTITQGIIFLCMNNVFVLSQLYESMDKQGEVLDQQNLTIRKHGNIYFQMAKEYIGEALELAERAKQNEESILLIENHIRSMYISINEQKDILADHKQALQANNRINTEQKLRLNRLEEVLKENSIVEEELRIQVSNLNDIVRTYKIALYLLSGACGIAVFGSILTFMIK
nr:hypothetical protein [Fredinandcohnia onubensis]